ncbi:unnamed protein product (macronuclear) [Paramecium tetraurelia]|uniref:very-long-chain (3R)-3-hydroxyacyl-CoA dehydratase n=1 Tax=Paramecium tetraurelia TaxID=5888 RepID=A0CR37_PARTE|nr:uncharacterized protein GSPATT00009568001 [Paramecium tetraurelia]CAK73254.1 unnamed protein product [Paramecium tetraurelia]|eukprot:XP_001440651.1 hypothetical protein (macronuclear) [Paramecium tetraurelia strain d4-2]
MFGFVSLAYNAAQLIGWSAILGLVILELVNGTEKTGQIVWLVQVMQISQTYDLISNIVGLTSGSLISNILQLGGRLVVALLFMYEGVCFCCLINAVIAWSLAEIIRFSYYLFKNNSLFKTLRYNAFMVLYPIGILGELRTVNQSLAVYGDIQIRGLQTILILGGFFMYAQMLNAKSKHTKQTAVDQKQNVKQRSNSPVNRPKRE